MHGIWQARGVHGIVGAARSAVSTPVAQLGAVDRMPQLSYWSSSPRLSDKAVYPYFGRTYPSDALAGIAMVSTIIHFGWKNFAVINTAEHVKLRVFEPEGAKAEDAFHLS